MSPKEYERTLNVRDATTRGFYLRLDAKIYPTKPREFREHNAHSPYNIRLGFVVPYS